MLILLKDEELSPLLCPIEELAIFTEIAIEINCQKLNKKITIFRLEITAPKINLTSSLMAFTSFCTILKSFKV